MAHTDNFYLQPFLTNSTSSISNTVLYTGGNIYTVDTTWPPVKSEEPVVEGTLKPEHPVDWLRRRVEEVCWNPVAT